MTLTQTIRPDGQVQANLSYVSGHIYGIAFNQQDMVAFQRDDLHRETTRLLANGLVQNKNYNDVGLLSSQIIRHEQETLDQLQQAKHQAERHYHYDNNYLLTQVDDSRLGKLSYQYDPIGRLIKAQNPYSSESFSFDPAGNLIDPIATQTSQVKNNLITQYQGKHYKYDAQGNVIETSQSGQTLKLTWDNLNRLIQSDHNGQITSYGYDVFGRRLYKHSLNDAKTEHSSELTLFGWDGDLMIWESYKTNSNQANKQDYTKHYVYEPDSFVPLLQTGYTRFIELIETPDYRQFQGVPYSIYKDPVWKTDTRKNKAELERVAFYHCDQVGTPQTLSNELGECIWEIKQDTWGKALEIKSTEQDNPFGHSNIRFQGQYYDKETGLHYNRYRYYEPYSARYVSKDPIGLFGGLNNSVYVSDPNQWIDPMGLQNKKIDLRLNDKAAWDRYVARQKADLIELKAIGERAKQKGPKVLDKKNFMQTYLSDDVYTPESHLITVPEMQKGAIKYYCDKAGGCVKPDYIACSVSGLGVGGGVVKNLHARLDQGWYISTSKSALEHISQEKLKQIAKAQRIDLGGACAIGIIDNIKPEVLRDLSRKQIVEEFVTGASLTTGAVAVVGANFVNPMTTSDSPIYGSHSMELVIGTPSVNVDIGNTYKTVGIK